MCQFFLIETIQQKIISRDKKNIVYKMRQIEWKGHSTNSDYMHVYSVRNREKYPGIRYLDENHFVADLTMYGLITKISFFDCLLHLTVTKLLGRA